MSTKSKNQLRGIKKRKKYLMPDASDQEKVMPRTSLWRGQKHALTDQTDSQEQAVPQSQEEIEDAMDAGEEDHEEFVGSELSEIDFEDNRLSIDGDLSGEDAEDVESESTEGNNNDPIFHSSCLADNLKSFELPLFDNAPTTVAETLLMIMTFAMKHNLTWTAVEDLLKMFNTVFGQSVLPQAKYTLNKIFETTDSMTFHFYCTDCHKYLGKHDGHLNKSFNNSSSGLTCTRCNKMHDAKDLKEGSFFATLSIKNQLAAILDLEEVRESLSATLKVINENLYDIPESVSDLTDGKLYKKKRRELFKEFDISLIMNTDGSPVFKSSRASMWLIQALINELPPRLRWAHGIIGGLWFGKGHPDMKLFMEAYVNELQELSVHGVKWRNGEEIVESRVYTLCGCFDSPARCSVQNMTQFNGYFGCPWCYHPGVLIDGVVKYVTLEDEDPELRTESETLQIMDEVLHSDQSNIKGIKGSSPMILAKGLDFIKGVCPEYMHAVLLGVTRQVTEIYLTGVGAEHYIGSPTHLSRIDARLLKIKPPHLFTRLPRSIAERKFWKAHEWKTWLLYYAAPCLCGILPEKFLKHFSLLSNSVFLLLQDTVHQDDIDSAEKMLTEFVIETEILFGPAAMTFNVHQMLHLSSSVRDLGPLWAHSAFTFESSNGKMLNLVTAAKGVPLQILNKFCMEKKLQHLFSKGSITPKVSQFYESLHSHQPLKNCRTIGCGINMLGKEKISRSSTFSESEVQAYVVEVGAIPEVVSEYSRAVINNRMYHSETYKRAGKTDNTVVEVNADDDHHQFFKIQKFVVLSINNDTQCYILCRELLAPVQGEQPNYMPKHVMKRCLVPTGHFTLIPVEKIKSVCAFIEIGNTQYVSKIPNFHEKD